MSPAFLRLNLKDTLCRNAAGRNDPGLLVRALKTYRGSNVIVYSPTTNRVEETVELLKGAGHQGDRVSRENDHGQRTRNQKRWMSRRNSGAGGDAGVWIGDYNKAAVRTMIHGAAEIGRAVLSGGGRAWGATDYPRIVFCCGANAMWDCWRILSGQLSDQRGGESGVGSVRLTIKRFVESAGAGIGRLPAFWRNPKWKTCEAATSVCGSSIEWLKRNGDRWRNRSGKGKTRRPAAAAGTGQRGIYVYARVMVGDGSGWAAAAGHRQRIVEEWRGRRRARRERIAVVGLGEKIWSDFGRGRRESRGRAVLGASLSGGRR